ncbi:MAG: hypothetical protein A2033_19505 [Bacteroidetes bacterium GWA2_31_9]|nr:MAG: hypothetical protein A2033_19505 [Bacteroidetes bacterium GWA2_31_9]
MKLNYWILIFSILVFTGCRVGVELPYNVAYTLNNSDEVSVESPANQKYVNYYTKEDYKNKFENYLKDNLNKYNISFSTDLNSKLKININKFRVYELQTSETVSDETSPDYGTVYNVNSCYVSYKYSVDIDGENIGEWSVYEEKAEQITNRRSFFDYLFGTNKDNSSYRHKDLPQDVFDKIIENAAKSGAARMSRKIKKHL